MDYASFIERKSQSESDGGFAPVWMPAFLFDFQQHLVDWALRKGRAAIFADTGLGKTAMQLVWAENVVRHTNKPVLILTPLAVGSQTKAEGEKFGIECTVTRDGTIGKPGIYITNYERLHYFDPANLNIVCDESSILKHFSGATQQAVTRFMSKMDYRLLCTATAAPNDYHELGTSSQALGYLGYSDMLTRFFVMEDKKRHRMNDVKLSRGANTGNHYAKLAYRVSQQIGMWRMKGHAEEHFWKWICSWARACRMPSDLGYDDARFILPKLNERHHVITPNTPPDGMLFTLPAFGLKEELAERRRTTQERCETAARLVDHDRPAVIWCHLNEEGDRLEKLIPNAVQVAGKHSDEYKSTIGQWFAGNKCICNDPMFRAKLATWKKSNDPLDTGPSTIRNIVQRALNRQNPGKEQIENIKKHISLPITRKISTSIKRQRSNARTEGIRRDSDMLPTPHIVTNEKRSQKSTENESLISESQEQCGDTDQLSKSTSGLLSWDALSVEHQTQVIQEVTDCILTMITRQESLEGCSALNAILDSESLQTIQSALKELSCICGHKSGNRKLVTKSKIYGWGLNWQHCAHVVTFVSHSYEQYYQSVRRCYRYGQERSVTVDIIASEGEDYVRANMQRKAESSKKMFARLVEHMNDALSLMPTHHKDAVTTPSWMA